MGNYFSDASARDDLEALDQGRLFRVGGRHEQPLIAELLQASSRDQHAIDMADSAVERKLTEKGAALGHPPTRFSQRDCNRYRQIERGAGLPHLRRREIHGEALTRKCEAAVLDRRPHTLARFLD